MITQFVLVREAGDYVNPAGYPSMVGQRLTLVWHAGAQRPVDVTAHCRVDAEETREDGATVLTLGRYAAMRVGSASAARVQREVATFRTLCTTPRPGDLLPPPVGAWDRLLVTCLHQSAGEDDATLGAITRALLAERDRLLDVDGDAR